jgi:hypothetical protein
MRDAHGQRIRRAISNARFARRKPGFAANPTMKPRSLEARDPGGFDVIPSLIQEPGPMSP